MQFSVSETCYLNLSQNGASSSWQECKYLTVGLHILGIVSEWHGEVVLT